MNSTQKEEYKYYLYNFMELNKLILYRKDQIMEEGNISLYDWNTKHKSLDDIIISIEEDPIIIKYKIIQDSIKILIDVLIKSYRIEYKFFINKYIKKVDDKTLNIIFNNSNIDFNDIDNNIIKILDNIYEKKR